MQLYYYYYCYLALPCAYKSASKQKKANQTIQQQTKSNFYRLIITMESHVCDPPATQRVQAKKGNCPNMESLMELVGHSFHASSIQSKNGKILSKTDHMTSTLLPK